MALNQPRIKLFPLMMILTVIALITLVWSGVKLYQAHDFNHFLKAKSLHTNSTLGSNETLNALFANAVRYAGQGQTEQALASYARLIAKSDKLADADLLKAAHFNTGNLYFNQAMDKLEKDGLPGWDVAGPLVSFAKESYQKALRIEPTWSEVKYNYQLALRLAPSTHGARMPQLYEDDNLKQEEKPSGWPAMPGNPRGMP